MIILKKPIFLTIVVILFTLLNVNAQRKHNKYTIAADNAFKSQKYSYAITKYKKAYSKTKHNRAEKTRISFQLAECYRLTNNMRRAEPAYRRLIRLKYYRHEPKVYLYYADVLKANGKYDEAIEQYQEYKDKYPEDKKADFGIESCNLAKKWTENPTNYKILKIKKINSKFDDFAPTYADRNHQALIFTSSREESTGKDEDEWTGQNFSDLFYTRKDRKGDWSTPVLLDEEKNINTETNEGSPFINSKFNKLYFTRCKNSPGKHGCEIYVSNRAGKSFSKPVYLSLKGGDSTSVFAHPSLSDDELTIYFVSNIRGGKGGKDIWVATRESKTDNFKRPENLGSIINTEADEMFPFLRNDSTLYFASNGHPGMGGLDIFKTQKIDGKWQKPENLKYPINSNADDFAIIFNPEEKEEGYFCSNRKGGLGHDDIYFFVNPPLLYSISGTVKDNRTLQFVTGAKVTLVGSDGSSIQTNTSTVGTFTFNKNQVFPNTTYELTISKDNYFNIVSKITTVGLEHSEDFVKDYMLNPISEEPIVLPDILYDLAKWDLKPQYQDSLQGLIQTLGENPNIVIELASHTDSRDTKERNDILSQKRAESVVNYLILRGIDPDRLIAKGYGERVPRKLSKDITINGFTFKKGVVLDDDFIESLKTDEEKEAAHQLNRRTDFTVISKDYIPRNIAGKNKTKKVNIILNPEENIVKFAYDNKHNIVVPCIINEFNQHFTYNEKINKIYISLETAKKLLRKGAISKFDFKGDIEKILANGTIADKAVIVIKNFRIGDKTLNNIEFIVSHKLKENIILGKTALSEFGDFNIDTKKNIIIFK
ncbi:MAG: OmpA family protein [Bacteroidales bacterium]|nr:OmpA family protein [Bacteroidales bacterium]